MDIGIDLGTANVLISMGSKGIVLNEPSVVAYNKKTEEIIAVGGEADKMTGKTPDHIVVIRPLSDGVISDYNMNECMISEFIHRVTGRQMLMPRIVMCIPSSITDVESRAVVDAARAAGARKIYLIEEPVAALLGSGVDISKPEGNMVIDIGGGTTDVAVVSMNGIVTKTSVKMAGNRMDEAIMKYVSAKYRVLIGEKTAESAKLTLANVYDPTGKVTAEVRGRHMLTGLPVRLTLTDTDIYEAIHDMTDDLVYALKNVLEQTPPELVGDIHSKGIMMSGGGVLLGGLDKLLTAETGINCYPGYDPMTCVAKGASEAFKHLDTLLDGFIDVSLY